MEAGEARGTLRRLVVSGGDRVALEALAGLRGDAEGLGDVLDVLDSVLDRWTGKGGVALRLAWEGGCHRP